ncbi:MAG: 50S ribosomal protein L11 methyltransferase [Chloroflexi bacterium]|nr:50S ribosomal protein L11 methyltransferase [Chloroflexota bacterium]
MKAHVSRWLYEMMPPTAGLYARLGSHQTMLMDSTRCVAYQRAINRVVRPMDVVLDVGTGTGILAFFAAHAGAKRVYAVESSPIASVADVLIRQNHLADQIVLIRGRAEDIELPEPIDVIVSETVGFWGIDEDMLATVGAMRYRYGSDTTRTIPEKVELYLVPIESALFYERVDFWRRDLFGFNYSALADLAANNVYVRVSVDPDEFLTTPSLVANLAVGIRYENETSFSTHFVVARTGMYHDVAGWFRLVLEPETWLSTDPRDEVLHWKQCIFPALEPIPLASGDTVIVAVTFRVEKDQVHFDWETTFSRRDARETFAHHRQSTRNFEALI